MSLGAVSPRRSSVSSNQKEDHGNEKETDEIIIADSADSVVPKPIRRRTREAIGVPPRRERTDGEEHGASMGVICEDIPEVRKGRGERLKPKIIIRPGFVWEVGARLEAKDFMDKWYSAKIVGIDGSDGTIRIHFDGWNQRYDEWVKMDSDRLRPLTRHSDRKRSGGAKTLYRVGESVYARWTDCRMYAAKIVSVNSNGSYEVMFDDGVKKTIKAINVDVKPPLSSIGSGRRPSDCSGKRRNSLASEKGIVKQRSDDGLRRSVSADVEEEIAAEIDEEIDDDRQTVAMKQTEGTPAYRQTAAMKQTEGTPADSPTIKRRLIHVKNLQGKCKKLMPSSPVGSGADEENEHRCPHGDCNKLFRNSTLVKYHVKYYHPDDYVPESPNEENPVHIGRKLCTSVSGESVDDVVEKRAKVRCSRSFDGESQGSAVDAGYDAGDLVDASASVPSTVDSSWLPQSLGSKLTSIALETRDRRQRMNRRRAKSLHSRRKRRMKYRSSDCSLSKKVINCICRGNAETSQLIQCSVCLCWQHLRCLQNDDSKCSQLLSNSSYICPLCASPARLRESARYSFCQDWLKEGRLAEFSEALEGHVGVTSGTDGKAKIMKLTHRLVADLHNVRRVVDSVNRFILMARDKIEGELTRQQAAITTKNSESSAGVFSGGSRSNHVSGSNESSQKAEMNDLKVKLGQIGQEVIGKSSPGAEMKVSAGETVLQPPVGRTEDKKESTQARSCVNLSSSNETQGPMKNECDYKGEETRKLVNGERSNAEKPIENDDLSGKSSRTATDNGLAAESDEIERTNDALERSDKIDRMMKEESESDEELVITADTSFTDATKPSIDDMQNQLLLYINQMQDNIEESLEIIEEQVTALESGEGSRSSSEDILKDVPRVKKTLNQLMTDLNKVHSIPSYIN